jgi:Tol biopolymer transport system component
VLNRPDAVHIVALKWYPDGKALLVMTNHTSYRVDVQTSASTVVLAPQANGNGTAQIVDTISPDGAFLYYKYMTQTDDVIMRLNLSTGARERIYESKGGFFVRTFSLSPDGSKIASYVSIKDAEEAVFVMPATGGEMRRIYTVPKGESAHAPGALNWTADGSAVLFHRVVRLKDELLRIPVNGGTAEKILTADQVSSLAVHPDGRHIAWESHSYSSEVIVVDNLFPKELR